jgi:hypothetical protein
MIVVVGWQSCWQTQGLDLDPNNSSVAYLLTSWLLLTNQHTQLIDDDFKICINMSWLVKKKNFKNKIKIKIIYIQNKIIKF